MWPAASNHVTSYKKWKSSYIHRKEGKVVLKIIVTSEIRKKMSPVVSKVENDEKLSRHRIFGGGSLFMGDVSKIRIRTTFPLKTASIARHKSFRKWKLLFKTAAPLHKATHSTSSLKMLTKVRYIQRGKERWIFMGSICVLVTLLSHTNQ